MTVTLPETGPLPVIVPDIERARNTPSPWRHTPRPTTLPPCPSWCDHDHGDAFGPDAIPVDNTSDGGPIWGLAHRREVVVGAAGGRPRRISDDDVAFIVATAKARPETLHGLWPSRYEHQSGVRPQGRHGHRRLLRATQQRDIPQLR